MIQIGQSFVQSLGAYLSLVLTLLCVLSGLAEAQVPSNVLLRVRMIGNIAGNTSGTAFTLEVDGQQYLITAKHLVAGLKAEDTIQIYKDEQWEPLKVKIFRCDEPIDIAVLVPPRQLTVTFSLEPTMKDILYGQDIYFVGFPYGLFTKGKNVSGLYPLPFIKKAIMSASTGQNGAVVIFLDGHNNPGFSGGPIVYRDLSRNDFTFKLAGVVSGFRNDLSPVLQPEEIKKEEIKPEDVAQSRIMEKNGHFFRLNDTEQVVKTNTGIVIGYSISHALDLIRRNPIGPKVSDNFEQ